ncbi:MAG: hydantoinase B/oxoprolinase family protein [Chloroflexi bacterium]|nr:hydantoinase B/oxoprolinase family protein [Chloroflexota bacterium]
MALSLDTSIHGVDPVTFSVVFHRLQTINKEMGITMMRTSRSQIFAEVHDFSCAICDWVPRVVAQVDGIPSHTASSMIAAKSICEKFEGDIFPGDIFIINDAYTGGTHLADLTVIKPIFVNDEMLFMAINRAHHEDVGGMTAGSYSPMATEIFHEGIRIPPLRICRDNQPIRDVVEMVKINTRLPEMLWSDIRAQIASCDVAEARLIAMVDEYGRDTMKAILEGIQVYAESQMRAAISELPEGTYVGEAILDDDGFDSKDVNIKVSLKVEGDEIIADFNGTHPQTRGPINSPIANSATSVYVAVMTTIGSHVPRTEGAYSPIKIIAPEGCLINPLPPAPVASATLDTACAILEAVWMALAQAVPDKVPAGWNRKAGPTFTGTDPRNGRFFIQFCFCGMGGAGANPDADGISFTSDGIDLGGLLAPNIETMELQCPQINLKHEFLTDSGGAGEFRGGLGITYKIKWLAPEVSASMHGDGVIHPPYGLFGGQPGTVNRPVINEGRDSQINMPSKGLFKLGVEDTYTLYSSGGGGWGDPLNRDPEKIREDVRNELVSVEKAKSVYGVALSKNLEIDPEATQKLRKVLKSEASKQSTKKEKK